MRRNIFVIGDLIIDHTVFVERPKSFQAAEGEDVFKVVRRQDMAGGAANSARILASLYDGQTYLWGVIGGSLWGTFRTILEVSQLLDNARSNIEFRGAQDETDAQMNTITRLIFLHDDGRLERTIRFDNVDHVHVSNVKRGTVMYHLERVHDERDPLVAIVINDLDKKCLTKKVVERIAAFAEKNDIPLFVDPKRERGKYVDIRATAILPNLKEWCYLTEQKGLEKRYEYWRGNLDNPDVLTKMANLSFRFLSNFRYHIITCDRLGAVIMAPHPKQKHLYAVYRAQAAQAKNQMVETPLGCGDLLTAVFAAEFDKTQEGSKETEMVLAAYHRANVAVGCYCDMSWHRMPTLAAVNEAHTLNSRWRPKPLAEPSISMLYYPRTRNIVLSQFARILPQVYSRDKKFNEELQRLLDEITAQTQQVTPKSIMLGAPSGSGKSRIIDGLLKKLPQLGIPVLKLDKTDLFELIDRDERDFTSLLKRFQPPVTASMSCFVIVDEAYDTNHFDERRKGKKTLDFLQSAHLNGIRFVFVDSLFHSEKWKKIKIMIDIYSRCTPVELPGILERPGDIALLIADTLLRCSENNGMQIVRVEGTVFLSVTDRILADGNTRIPLNSLHALYDNAKKALKSERPVLVHLDLPKKDRTSTRSSVPLEPAIFTISR